MNGPTLSLRNIVKAYEGISVLKGVSLEVLGGEIHALVGENGAGKSTLMNILFGMPVIQDTGGYQGEIVLEGASVSPRSPMEAMELGVGMVHQEFMLLPGFSVTENVKLNRERTRPNPVSRMLRPVLGSRAAALETLDLARMRGETRIALDRIGMTLDEGIPVGGLPVGHMQFVEIAREIDKENARLLVFDEPTAVLTEREADELLAVMRSLAAQGIAILFITHRLDEVLAVADRITVLRDGEVAARLDRADATVEDIARFMIGRTLAGATPAVPPQRGAQGAVLQVRDLRVAMPGEELHGLDLDVFPGEILGVGGLAGQGKLGLANGILGLFPATGSVILEGTPLPLGDARSALARGLGFVSEDRRGVGLLLDESVERNIGASAVQIQGRFLRGRGPLAVLDGASLRDHASGYIRDFDIRCRGPRQKVRRLSGGNQQKVCLARAFTLLPRLLFISEPTRGIDVGAKELVLRLLVEMNQSRGMTVVLTSSELVELRRICHRIAIIDGGRVVGILPPDAPDVEFGLLMGGETLAS